MLFAATLPADPPPDEISRAQSMRRPAESARSHRHRNTTGLAHDRRCTPGPVGPRRKLIAPIPPYPYFRDLLLPVAPQAKRIAHHIGVAAFASQRLLQLFQNRLIAAEQVEGDDAPFDCGTRSRDSRTSIRSPGLMGVWVSGNV